jgi:hypothetical protein
MRIALIVVNGMYIRWQPSMIESTFMNIKSILLVLYEPTSSNMTVNLVFMACVAQYGVTKIYSV